MRGGPIGALGYTPLHLQRCVRRLPITASGTGAPGRETSIQEPSRLALGLPILAILLVGLVVRLIMAYGIEGLRGSGFDTDLNLFRFWADSLATHGPYGFYERGFFADYTPGYLYALWLVGLVGSSLGGVGDLIKLPAIITDVVLAYVVYRMVLDLGVTVGRARLAAIVVLVNPITWFDSVIWGQVDSFGTVFLLLAVRELWKDRPERAAILAVVAALVKPQLAILVPIVAFVTIRRALWPTGAFGDEAPPERTGFGWERRTRGGIRVLTTGIAGLITAVVLAAPFGLSVVSLSGTAPFLESTLLRLVFSTAATYSYVTVNAYNLWALFPVDGQSTATNGLWIPDAPIPEATAWAQVGPFPAALVGGLLLGLLLFAIVPALVARKPDRLTILVGVCVLALAFFAVPTRVHERYLYPLFGLAAILFAFSWRWRAAYLLASFATFLNMYVVLTTLYGYMNPNVEDWLGIGEAIRSFWGVALVAVLHTVVFGFGLLQLRAGARQTLAEELEEGRLDARGDPDPARAGSAGPAASDPLPSGVASPRLALATSAVAAPSIASAGTPPGTRAEPRPAIGVSAAVGGGSDDVRTTTAVRTTDAVDTGTPALAGAATGGGAAPRARLLPAWFERPGWTELGPIGWLRSRMRETPIRPDRSRLLNRERGGRLDRLDLWILVVLVIAAMALRMFRLAEPARMHFDEVYHARTATEFLQSWRYGLDHTIYEWTHPHLAKYAMAGGIALFAGQDVAASSQVTAGVRDAAIEPRRDGAGGSSRAGDRVWLATGESVMGLDLHTRKPVAELQLPGATAVAFDPDSLQLYVGTDAGEVWSLDTTIADEIRSDSGVGTDMPLLEAAQVATLDGGIERLGVFDGGASLAARLGETTVAILDPGTGEERATLDIEGLGEMAAAGTGDAVVASPASIVDPQAVATLLADVLGGDAATYGEQLGADAERVVLEATLDDTTRPALEEAITDGRLEGITIEPVGQLAVAGADGVTFLGPSGAVTATVALPGGATAVALVSGIDDGTQVYATTPGENGEPEVAIIAVTGEDAKNGPNRKDTFPLPGAGERIVYDQASELVEVLGARQDGGGSTIYMVEPHGRAVFADHELPYAPSAWVLDHNGDYPADSRGAILAFGSAGAVAAVDVGHYHFSWRLPGVILGALTVGVLFLLARVLFARREVAVLVGLFAILDGMFFVQSRIAMNDVYTGFFILAAYLLFAWLWIERRRARWFWLLLPAIGVLLGLALAAKWVAAYAIGALGILILVRSALGRIVLIVGLVGVTGVLGWMAMAVPSESTLTGNLLFPLIMIMLTLAAVVVSVYHPIAWSDEEVRLAVGGPALLGMLIVLGAIALGRADAEVVAGPLILNPLTLGFALVVLGGLAYATFQVAGRYGVGPVARPVPVSEGPIHLPPPAEPAEGWLRLGSGMGLPIVWMIVCLLAIPLGVYVALYVPWSLIDGNQLVAGWPAGHAGQTLVALTEAMYRYHNDLTAAHAASSPWWAWPLNLKPVWFYQGSYASSTAGSIYDAGNMVIWWMGIPAMAFVAYQAFKRRSLALALVLIAFLCQWVSWARIDRASFQYHYYTSLPFVVLSLGYFMAELWHGASRRTWLLARVAAAVALMGPVVLWLLRLPLCGIAGVDSVNQGSQACHGNPGNLVVTPAVLAMAVVGLVTLLLLIRFLVRLARPSADARPLTAKDFVPVAATAVIGGLLLALTRLLPSTDPLLSFPGIIPELIALLVAIPLMLIATQVLTARDARRFVLGFTGVAAAWFVLLYPNISALPLPATLVNAYQGILPTYLYAFQFGVNTVERGATVFQDIRFAILIVFLVIACGVVAWSARIWRLAAADDSARGTGGPAGGSAAGPAGEPGGA
ncbi:MAG TPA: phospholipid carrier-dependent glycosyltransferase [Candidatus Limnocylindrales bacterium]|nr:phospholipid carrier-dependent glycosyltransferase [Candidatus Limnocylindrales bacterium]